MQTAGSNLFKDETRAAGLVRCPSVELRDLSTVLDVLRDGVAYTTALTSGLVMSAVHSASLGTRLKAFSPDRHPVLSVEAFGRKVSVNSCIGIGPTVWRRKPARCCRLRASAKSGSRPRVTGDISDAIGTL